MPVQARLRRGSRPRQKLPKLPELPKQPELPEATVRPSSSPLLDGKDYAAASVFRPENLLREARRQKALPAGDVPEICMLDPDGDLVQWLQAYAAASFSPSWACYHTQLHVAEHDGMRFGVVGHAVGASFAVLVAEQLFASGCRLLLSMTSAGQIAPDIALPTFVLIERSLRDEGTSLHYLPAAAFAEADPVLVERVMSVVADRGLPVCRGATWTTDAPFRETEAAIATARSHGVLAVEMESAALYAFALACKRPVVCFAHVTNQMARVAGDFEKGEANGALAALDLLMAAARACRAGDPPSG